MDDKKLFDAWKDKEVSPRDAKRARKMVWRTRFSISFSVLWTVLWTLLILFLLYFFYTMAVSHFYDRSDKYKFNRYITTLVEMHYSGVQVEKTGFLNVETSKLLTQKTTRTLYQRVGKWDVIIGEVTARKEFRDPFEIQLDWDGKYLNSRPQYKYPVPPDLLGKGEITGEPGSAVGSAWKRLDKIGTGYVAQMSFSTRRGMDPEELQQLLADYDVHLLQMPVYAGELTAIEDISKTQAGGGEGMKTFVPHLVLHPVKKYDEKSYLSSLQMWFFSKESVTEGVDGFMRDLKWLIHNGDYAWEEIDEKRLAYLQEHGVKVYGAVVTGPVQDLKKLENEMAFYHFELGKVELWNWE